MYVFGKEKLSLYIYFDIRGELDHDNQPKLDSLKVPFKYHDI